MSRTPQELPENRVFIAIYMALLMIAFSLLGALLASQFKLIFALLGFMVGGTVGSLVITSDAAILGSLRIGIFSLPVAACVGFKIDWQWGLITLLSGYVSGALYGHFTGYESSSDMIDKQ